MIISDPRAEAGASRGTLVESIDFAPTFVEAAGGTNPGHILEGRSLIPYLHGAPPKTGNFWSVNLTVPPTSNAKTEAETTRCAPAHAIW